MFVEEPAKLLVKHLPKNCSEDNLQNYFESKRKFSTGLDVTDVEILEDGDVAIVTFSHILPNLKYFTNVNSQYFFNLQYLKFLAF